MPITATCPLDWPEGWERSARSDAELTGGGQPWDQVLRRIGKRARLMRLTDVVISTNQPLRQDGLPYSARRQVDDTGVAIYFTRKGQQLVMAQDKYRRIEDNIRSVALSLEGIAQMDRHGGGKMLDRAFTGFLAIAAPVEFHAILEIERGDSLALAERQFTRLAMAAHPDMPDGSTAKMTDLNLAIEAARAALT